MNYKETMKAMELSLLSGSVPLIIGESGIGKTSLIKEYTYRNNIFLITVDANLLKEGEIGGLPMVNNGNTRYAPYHKLTEMDTYLRENKGKGLIFIDELNRCEHAVQQELMNIILNREINGYKLNDRVIVAAAMNPPNNANDSFESGYEVTDMDPAQEDRFVWLNMDSDPKEWIKWGMEEGKIHPMVIDFISTFRDYLNYKPEDESIFATPRSWERVSKSLYIYEKENFDEKTLYNVVKGNVGISLGHEFISFMKTNENLKFSPDSLYNMEVISQIIKDEIEMSTHSTLYILIKNMLLKFKEEKTSKNRDRFSEVLNLMPKDLRISLMKEIQSDYKDLFEALIKSDTFIEGFFDCYVRS